MWALLRAVEEIWPTQHEVNTVKAKLLRLNIESYEDIVINLRARQGGCIMNHRLKDLGEHTFSARSLYQLRRKFLYSKMTRIIPFSSQSISNKLFVPSDEMATPTNGIELSSTQKFAQPHNAHILFTAPHNIPLFRDSGIHKKEDYTTHLASQWAQYHNGALLCWSRSEQDRCGKIPSPDNVDPNYLHVSDLELNPWFLSLQEIRDRLPHKPILHVDIHGCYVGTDEAEMYLGLGPMEQKNPALCEEFRQALTRRLLSALAHYSPNRVLEPRPKGRFTGICRGENRLTLTQQSIKLNYDFAVQIEFSYHLRRRLFKDTNFRNEVGEAFLQAVDDVL